MNRCKFEYSIEFVLVALASTNAPTQGLQRDHKHIEMSGENYQQINRDNGEKKEKKQRHV